MARSLDKGMLDYATVLHEFETLLGRRLSGAVPGPRELPHITGQTVLVTGAAGSIGSNLCGAILTARPRRLVLYDWNEDGLAAVLRALGRVESPVPLEPVLGSVLNRSLLHGCFDRSNEAIDGGFLTDDVAPDRRRGRHSPNRSRTASRMARDTSA